MAGLIDSIQGMLGGQDVAGLASRFGESPAAITSALGGVVPTLLGGLLGRTESGDAAGAASLIAGNTGTTPGTDAGGLASALFGGKLSAIASGLASTFGVKAETITGLFGMAGPAVASAIQSRLGGNVTADGVSGLLQQEKGAITSALPGGIGGLLGGLGLGGLGAGAASTAGAFADRIQSKDHTVTTGTTAGAPAREVHVAPESGGGIGKWIPWLIGALAIIGLIWGLKSCNSKPEAVTNETELVNTVEPTAEPSPTVAAIPEGAGVTSGERDGKPMVTVYFDTAKAEVAPGFPAAAEALKTYHDANSGARYAVTGFADPRGNAAMNAALSKKRAEAVKGALATAGIPATAIDMVKPADTEDKTATDNSAARRVEVTVK